MISTATAPASSANLGPGFDALALALELRCTATVEPAREWAVYSAGESVGRDSLIERAAAFSAGPLQIRIESAIPRARGMGSSSAVCVATAAAAIRSTGREPEDRELFEMACRLEGHGDNAAAAVYGGLVAVAGGAVLRLSIHDTLRPIIAVPDSQLSTTRARQELPSSVDHVVAARSVARTAALVHGLATGSAGSLAAAAGDELHERPRAALSPISGSLVEAATAAGALHAAWSGAGTAVLALATADAVSAVSNALAAAMEEGGEVLTPEIATTGWR